MVTVIRPKYVKNFKCDGKRCGAKCCKYWMIHIDKETYEKYSALEETKGAMTDKFQYQPERQDYLIKLNADYRCPFLASDNLCGIQKNYGEEFLSIVCRTYPRHITKVGDIYQCDLSLACPLAAEMILSPKTPIKFEFVAKNFFVHKPHIGVRFVNLNVEVVPYILKIQSVAIYILQERALTIDNRLAILGLYLNGLQEILSERTQDFQDLIDTFSSREFITGTAHELLADVTFCLEDFVRLMIGGILENLYRADIGYYDYELKFLDALKDVLDLHPAPDNTISIAETTKKFVEMNDAHEKFCEKFQILFENYLVHEFFVNFYPFNSVNSIRHNYGQFVAAYKLVEFFLFILAQNAGGADEATVIAQISDIARQVDHSKEYLDKICSALEEADNVFKIMSTFLKI